MPKVGFEKIDETRALVNSLALMLGVDVQGMFLDDAAEEIYDAAVALRLGSEVLTTVADIAANRGSTEANLELVKAKAAAFQEALTYVGDLSKDYPAPTK